MEAEKYRAFDSHILPRAKLRIALVTPVLTVGGGQRYITALANYYAEMGHEIHLLVMRNGEVFYPVDKSVRIHGLCSGRKGSLADPFHSLQIFIKLTRYISRLNPDFVLSIHGNTNVVSIASTILTKTPVFVRDTLPPARIRKGMQIVGRKIFYPRADGIIAQTKDIMNATTNELKCNKIRVIQNPVRKIDGPGQIEREKIVLGIGELTPRKGFVQFIEIASRTEASEWKFVILGDGPKKDELKALIKKKKMEDRISVLGAVRDIDPWLKQASIFLMTSNMEGLPNALIEAMTAGMACVSFDCDTGPRDLIHDGVNGYLVKLGDIDDAASKIQHLMDHVEIRESFSQNAKFLYDELNVKKIGEEVLEFCLN